MTRLALSTPALPILALFALTACGETSINTRAQSPSAIAPPIVRAPAGMDRVLGRDARSLTQLFGTPAQDVREENGRKLQFSSNDCILDAYLYPPARGREPVVTYVAARTLDGKDAERQSCINALARRR
jgi:hypothetical protein